MKKNNSVKDVICENDKYYEYDVVVIGAGHAGCEAALASAKNSVKTLLITINLDSIALMPCNGAIGGPGRGQLVREIDILGGEIGKNTDRNFIHSRIINTSKGPALRTIRAIVDKKRYLLDMKRILENQLNLDIKQGLATVIEKDKNIYLIKINDGTIYKTKSVVITTGTFLRGKIFWGKYELNAGRLGEINSVKLAQSLEKLGFEFSRLRTETPPRVDKKSVYLHEMKVQKFDNNPKYFSFEKDIESNLQVKSQTDVHITYIDNDCINYILDNIEESTIFLKSLESNNPRYCPSIEDKVLRFPYKKRHIVFIQPEGNDTNEVYLHGLFTTLSEEIQENIIHRIKGLENAIITRPGYGVEYDYLKPFQIKSTLESKSHKGLFFAGQINGTTGYEEAAAQGIIAGINASLFAKNKKLISINREDGYIGVLIDDIVTKGVTEPYRMLTSRNEFRLFHRHDNADFRMLSYIKKINLDKKVKYIEEKYKKIKSAFNLIKKSKYYTNKEMLEKIKQDQITAVEVDRIKKDFGLNQVEYESLIINIKYELYFKRELERINQLKMDYDLAIPENINYADVKNISKEAITKLEKYKPENILQVKQIEGIKPLDVLSLIAYIKMFHVKH